MITYGELFRIREGLNALNGIKSFALGLQRAKIAQIIDPEIKAIQEGLQNEEFEQLKKEMQGKTEEEQKKAEKEPKVKEIIETRKKQVADYNKHLQSPYEKNNIPRIKANLLPEDIDTKVVELLYPILILEDKDSIKSK